MIRISVSEARKKFSDVVSRVEYAGERAILHRHGRETAALVPIVDVILLDLLEQQMDIEETRNSITETLKRGGATLSSLLHQQSGAVR